MVNKTPARPRLDARPAGLAAKPAAYRWLLFVHQLPASPSNLRVRTWRRLQQLGAVPVRQAVYVLPDAPATREDFEWLRTEVKGAGGDASIFAADTVDAWSDDALVEAFRRSRQDAYAALGREIEAVLGRHSATRRPRGSRRPAIGRLADGFRQRLAALEHIDFFGSAGRDSVVARLAQLEDRARTSPPGNPTGARPGSTGRAAYVGRLWVTRPRPGVDRMSSAWLIRRFVDPNARFGFAADAAALPSADAIPYDMFGVEFGHRGEDCTFETLCAVFDIRDPAVTRVASIVHDLDLKDERFGPPEAATIATVIEGFQLAASDDHDLLERGITLFDSLYRAFAQAARTARPRPVAKSRAHPAPPRQRRKRTARSRK